MLDTIDRTKTTTTELPLATAAKRALIESELRDNPNRSAREIARALGNKVDHKTVAARRREMGLAEPLGNSPQPPTAVDDALRDRVVSLAPGKIPPPPGVIDEPEENPFRPESEDLVIPSQPAIAVYTNRYNQIVIRQEATGYDDEDKFVYICPQHLDTLIVRLRKFLP